MIRGIKRDILDSSRCLRARFTLPARLEETSDDIGAANMLCSPPACIEKPQDCTQNTPSRASMYTPVDTLPDGIYMLLTSCRARGSERGRTLLTKRRLTHQYTPACAHQYTPGCMDTRPSHTEYTCVHAPGASSVAPLAPHAPSGSHVYTQEAPPVHANIPPAHHAHTL